MASYNIGIDKTYKASGDLSTYQYRPVILDTDGKVVGCSALSSSAIGILQNEVTAANEEAVVRVFGFSKVWACGAASVLEVGGYVKTGGGVVGGVTGFKNVNAASTWALGVAQEGLTSGCAYVEIFFNPIRTGA